MTKITSYIKIVFIYHNVNIHKLKQNKKSTVPKMLCSSMI